MHRSIIALALLSMAPLAGAQVYKWKDANGTVHYSQSPPAQGTPFKEMKADPTSPSAPAAVAAPPAAAAAPQPAAAPVADTPENRARLCTSLKSNLAALQGSGPVVMQQGDKQTALDDGQRKQQAAVDQTQYQQYCAK